MTEPEIQNILYERYTSNGHIMAINNMWLFLGEADFITVTKALLVHEFEIKCSRSDFLNEFRKKGMKHRTLQEFHNGGGIDGYYSRPPNYFWFVAPDGIIKDGELPDYAGHVIITNSQLKEVKKAPRLHSKKLRYNDARRIWRGLMFRYWNMRMRED